MRIFHEVSYGDVSAILEQGLFQGSHGKKTEEPLVDQVNSLLDSYRPDAAIRAGICRMTNIYGYVGIDEKIIDITDGRHIDLAEFIKNNSNALLELMIDPTFCYVADLDQYDAIRNIITVYAPDEIVRTAIDRYWDSVVPLQMFTIGEIRRPEVFVTYNVPSSKIHHIQIG